MHNSLIEAEKIVIWAHMENIFSNNVILQFLKLIPFRLKTNNFFQESAWY